MGWWQSSKITVRTQRNHPLPRLEMRIPQGSLQAWRDSWVDDSNMGKWMTIPKWPSENGGEHERDLSRGSSLFRGKERWKILSVILRKGISQRVQDTCHLFCSQWQPPEVSSETNWSWKYQHFQSQHLLIFLHLSKGGNILPLCVWTNSGKGQSSSAGLFQGGY